MLNIFGPLNNAHSSSVFPVENVSNSIQNPLSAVWNDICKWERLRFMACRYSSFFEIMKSQDLYLEIGRKGFIGNNNEEDGTQWAAMRT